MRFQMMMATLVLAASVAGPALAQQQPPPPHPTEPFPNYNLQSRLATEWRPMQSDRLQYEQFLSESRGNNVYASLERVDLANRVSGLIELGKCEEARALALEEGDRTMALRARQLCRTRRN